MAYLIYDSNIDYEKPFISNLTQVKLELEIIPISYTTSYYAKMALEYAYFEFVKIKNGKRPEAHTYYVLLSAYKSSSYPAAGIGTTIRTFNKNKMFAVGNSHLLYTEMHFIFQKKNSFALSLIPYTCMCTADIPLSIFNSTEIQIANFHYHVRNIF